MSFLAERQELVPGSLGFTPSLTNAQQNRGSSDHVRRGHGTAPHREGPSEVGQGEVPPLPFSLVEHANGKIRGHLAVGATSDFSNSE